MAGDVEDRAEPGAPLGDRDGYNEARAPSGDRRLHLTASGLQLVVPGAPPITAATDLLQRPRPGADLLWRAVLGGKGSVVDATAGLGADAFHLAAKGARVTMIERSELLAALLRDALERAASGALGAGAAEAAGRLELRVGDALELLAPSGDVRGDVVYLDPMFGLGGRAAPPKGMAVLRALLAQEGGGQPVGDAAEAALLSAARRAAARRVVVKRARRAQPLAGLRPSGSLTGRTVRFDLYAPL